MRGGRGFSQGLNVESYESPHVFRHLDAPQAAVKTATLQKKRIMTLLTLYLELGGKTEVLQLQHKSVRSNQDDEQSMEFIVDGEFD